MYKRQILADAGSALMGVGESSGEERGVGAARKAISSPLLESSIEGARGILLNITGGSALGLLEVNEAAEIIQGVAHPDANIIFGTVIDEGMGDAIRVTVIAAGFDRWGDATTTATAAPAQAAPVAAAPVYEPEEVDVFDDLSDPFEEAPMPAPAYAETTLVESDAGADDGDFDDLDVPSFLK